MTHILDHGLPGSREEKCEAEELGGEATQVMAGRKQTAGGEGKGAGKGEVPSVTVSSMQTLPPTSKPTVAPQIPTTFHEPHFSVPEDLRAHPRSKPQHTASNGDVNRTGHF